jgi:L-ascorbate metabolism protein UlaG (beta-lactamase superfamily)
VIVTHLGHSCLLVETGGARILLDPGGFTPDLEKQSGLDAILITHQHPDHLDRERIPQVVSANPGVKVYCEPSTVSVLAGAGVEAGALGEGDEVDLGGITVTGVGHQHAEIYREIPRIGNVGMLLRAVGEPNLLHPGDSLATTPDGIDILATPLSAPWSALKETIDFVRAVKPGRVFPIHDAVVSQQGRGIYYRQLANFLPEGTKIQDLAGAGPTTF